MGHENGQHYMCRCGAIVSKDTYERYAPKSLKGFRCGSCLTWSIWRKVNLRYEAHCKSLEVERLNKLIERYKARYLRDEELDRERKEKDAKSKSD
jgi:hypothetical protein